MTRRSWLYSCCALLALNIPAYPIKDLKDIQVGATYHMILTTGDELEGVVDSKTDTSLILDSKGTPYTFVGNLIVEYKLLAPAPSASTQGQAAPGIGAGDYSYEELQHKQPIGARLDVRIANGTSFTGTLISIDDEYLKIDVNGSQIPLAKTVVNKISAANSENGAAGASNAKPKKVDPEIFDTLIIKNKETDDYGKPKDNIVLIGKITKESTSSVSFTTKDNASDTYPLDLVVRIFRHTQENAETDLIARYAKPLICPPGMMLVDIPPGKSGRPFLKVCIDKYEYPNKEGVNPKVSISFAQAQALCAEQGKRLCTAQEWQWACSGIEGYTYSYGWNFDKAACNTDGRYSEPSGNKSHCIGKFGIMDMVGNVFEWVNDADGNAAAMGGPMSKCQTISPGANGDAKPQTGLRCCKSN